MLRSFLQLLSVTARNAKNLNRSTIHVPVVNHIFDCTIKRHLTSTTVPGLNVQPYVPSLQIVRNYAKNKDKRKEKGKAKIEINEAQLAEIINLDSLKTHMEKAVNTLKDDYIKHLSLRSTTGSIESIQVVVDGKEHALQELAQIVRKNPKTIVVNMAIFPQVIPAAIKAIAKSGMNLNPQQDGTTLYIPVPTVTKEHRGNLAKNAKALFTKCRDSLRDVQNKHLKNLKKKEGVSRDLIKNIEQQIIAIADKHISEAEKIMQSKQHELLGKD
ncbi:hypothetical protein ILUMI_08922 [Ignelater luminosus]|uniref:Ribosome-recycling factor, mitochondrial n=1 Tax=Ignelater luminosus TaxID=2038154 RepID=A0A8K0D0Z9_IGNLU|nr:hypothetical protein ILUMI_08922 [Ignelater luminosus]